jgi:hypothetical protein
MGTSTTNLMGGGLPAQLAADCGLTVVAVAGSGTTQAGTPTLLTGGNFYNVTVASSQTALILPANAPIGTSIEMANTTGSAVTALIFGQTGETIQGGAANASFSVAQNKTAKFIKVALLTWVVNLTA